MKRPEGFKGNRASRNESRRFGKGEKRNRKYFPWGWFDRRKASYRKASFQKTEPKQNPPKWNQETVKMVRKQEIQKRK